MIARLLLLCFLWCAPWVHATPVRTLHDMAGSTVTVPTHVERIATVGPVPVLNSLVFAVDEGRRIVNGLPVFAQRPRWGYQTVFAPHTAQRPSMQGPDYGPNLEALMQAAPDVVLTMDRATAETINRTGLPALYLAWRKPEDVKSAVSLLGQLFNKPEAAARYAARFDEILGRVNTALQRNAPKRPRVLYFSPSTLRQPHLIAEWWIRAAGGDSVTDDGRQMEARSFTLEQLLAWDPDFLIVSCQEEADAVFRDPRFAGLKAVHSGNVLAAPCGAHTWSNRTSEQPLMVLWAATKIHPLIFADVSIQQETRRFYRDIFGIDLSAAQVDEILAGGPRALPVAR
ncbi:MAG: ABC transporter substrate-binding protein [Giesbergeria sp.]